MFRFKNNFLTIFFKFFLMRATVLVNSSKFLQKNIFIYSGPDIGCDYFPT